jgi:hypothetical protein
MRQATQPPSWWNRDDESAWERVKEAFRRDWEQTKHDFGGDEPDLKQDVGDTVSQAIGKQPIPPPDQPNFEAYEPAYRFGYAARRQYGDTHPEWNEQLEAQLRTDWETTYADPDEDWEQYQSAVRRGWEYEGDTEKTRVL